MCKIFYDILQPSKQKAQSMYIPAYLKKSLKNPESLAHEVQRRKLKAILAAAAQAVRAHEYPASPLRPFSITEMVAFEKRLAKEEWRTHGTASGRLAEFAKPESPEMKRYAESVEHREAAFKYRIEHKKLKQIEADARTAYHAFTTTQPESDLE
jgi:hypothetical protein